ncbi:hypothetical protein [Streptomyces sp. NPDC058953]|uniref:hypothetical protein n=1 Tax=unclassified Streptomyces TaxID=2593676 RepID=UPI00367DE3F2
MPRPDNTAPRPGETGVAAPGAGPSAAPRPRMLHGFRPGRAIAGTAALAATLVFAGDAAGSWSTPWFVVFPVVFGGLALAGAAGLAHYAVRRRRLASSASAESSGAPPSTSGSQAIR